MLKPKFRAGYRKMVQLPHSAITEDDMVEQLIATRRFSLLSWGPAGWSTINGVVSAGSADSRLCRAFYSCLFQVD